MSFFAETLVGLYIGLEKLSMFVFLSVCVSRDSRRRNFPIRLKFGTNGYVLSEISYIVFDIHCLNSAYTGKPKSISMNTLMNDLLWDIFYT